MNHSRPVLLNYIRGCALYLSIDVKWGCIVTQLKIYNNLITIENMLLWAKMDYVLWSDSYIFHDKHTWNSPQAWTYNNMNSYYS